MTWPVTMALSGRRKNSTTLMTSSTSPHLGIACRSSSLCMAASGTAYTFALRAVNAVGDLGGALEDMPLQAVTIGMKEILGAKKLRLAVFRDWHRAVCRRAAYGEVTSAFPATLAQLHPDALLYVNKVAAAAAY